MPSYPTRPVSAVRAFFLPAVLLAVFLGLGCTSGRSPAYPTPEDPAIEDTEHAEVLGIAGGDDAESSEDNWEDPSADRGRKPGGPEKR